MNTVKDTVLIACVIVAAIAGLVAVAALTNGAGADAETQKALSYAVVGGVGALGGAARRKGD
jgi:hypothetical protein